eukprot:6538910-Pyramimonas_sp.AAC.1
MDHCTCVLRGALCFTSATQGWGPRVSPLFFWRCTVLRCTALSVLLVAAQLSLLALGWACAVGTNAAAFVGPLVLGRAALQAGGLEAGAHDVYACALGAHLAWAILARCAPKHLISPPLNT